MEVHDKLDVFNQVIQHLNTGSPEALGLSERAIQAYEQKAEPNSYFELFKRLEKEVERPDKNSGNWAAQNSLVKATGTAGVATGGYLDPATVLTQFGYLAEMAMANGMCKAAPAYPAQTKRQTGPGRQIRCAQPVGPTEEA